MTALLTITLFLSHADPTAAPAVESVYFPKNLYLVRATTVDTWREKGAIHDTGHLRVTRVVAGPDRLRGKDFLCLVGSLWPFASGFGPGIETPLDGVVQDLEKGAEGLWWVYEDLDYQALRPELRWKEIEAYRLHPFPYQKGKKTARGLADLGDPRLIGVERTKWAEALAELRRKDIAAWEEAVAAVYGAKTDADRRVLLEKYAAAPESPVSGWAIALLARGPKEPAVKFLTGLTGDGKLDPDAQLTLDRKLCQLDPKDWPRFPARLAMFRRWLDPKAPDHFFALGCPQLGGAVWMGELDVGTFADVIGPALAAGDRLTKEQTRILGHLLTAVRFRPADRGKGFDFLAGLVKTAKTPWLRGSAATGLRQFRPPTADEEKAVRQLREDARDPDVITVLDGVLALPR